MLSSRPSAAALRHGDVAALLAAMPNASVDSYRTKDLCLIPHRVALALQADGWYVRSTIIWHKPNPMPESVTDRPTKSHEYVFLLTKSARYFFDADAIKEPASLDTHARYARGRGANPKNADGGPGGQTIARTFAHMLRVPGVHPKSAAPGSGIKANSSFSAAVKDVVSTRNKRDVWTIPTQSYRGANSGGRQRAAARHDDRYASAEFKSYHDGRTARYQRYQPTTRNKRDVWTIPTQSYKGAHFATFPEKLVEPCILAGSRPDGVVLDPFFGSGTVGVVALRHGRTFIGFDLSKPYLKLAAARIAASTSTPKRMAAA